MRTFRTLGAVLLFTVFALAPRAQAAELTAHGLDLSAGATADVVVSGSIAGDSTFGVSVMLEIVPRPGAFGTVLFTPSPPVDIVQLDDPWPDAGTFTPFDTDSTFSDTWNGYVDDNGTLVPEPHTFSGNLASFPICVSEDGCGVWDVVLSTPFGESGWEGVPTTLTSGTISVASGAAVPTVSEWGMVVMTLLMLAAGTLILMPRRAPMACPR